MSVTVKDEIDAKHSELLPGTLVESGVTVNNEAVGSNPTLAATDYDDDEGLWLVPFKPTVPAEVSVGVKLAREPQNRRRIQELFLDVLRATASVVDAAKVCKIPRTLAFAWRSQDPEFRTRWDEAIQANVLPQLEAEAIRRAMNGSDLMLIFMLKALNREKYDDKAAEKVVSKPSVTIQIRDVDKSLVAIASSNDVPGIDYATGKVLNGQNAEIGSVIEAEYKQIGPGDGPIASTEGASKK